jgi:hypothetical protein
MADRGVTQAYWEAFAALAEVYLEDSWVLGIRIHQNSVIFRLEAVLTAGHQLYRPPSCGNQHCYRRASMTVRSDRPLSLRRSGQPPALDASGEVDLGNIDTLVRVAGTAPDVWQLNGDWGELLAIDPAILLELD